MKLYLSWQAIVLLTIGLSPLVSDDLDWLSRTALSASFFTTGATISGVIATRSTVNHFKYRPAVAPKNEWLEPDPPGRLSRWDSWLAEHSNITKAFGVTIAFIVTQTIVVLGFYLTRD